jgi:hypothetical protein
MAKKIKFFLLCSPRFCYAENASQPFAAGAHDAVVDGFVHSRAIVPVILFLGKELSKNLWTPRRGGSFEDARD